MSAPLLKRLADVRKQGDVGRLAEAIPYAQWMNIAPENSTGELLTRMRFTESLIGNTHLPAIHGGTLGAMLEMAAIFHLLWETDTETVPIKIYSAARAAPTPATSPTPSCRSARPSPMRWRSRSARNRRSRPLPIW